MRLVSLIELIPYARNARTHSDSQVAQIAASIREFGWTNPILTDGARGVIAGHGRLLAARQLGLAEVPVIELRHLTEAQKRAYILADNRLAERAGWDSDLLKIELGELKAEGFDLDLTGFDAKEVEALLAETTAGLTDPDAAPPAPKHPVTRPGDLWVLGRHRLLCGDSTVATDVARVLGEVKPLLMVTDPPYGVSYDPSWREGAGLSKASAKGKVLNDSRADWREAWALFPGDIAYVWHGGLHAAVVAESLQACRLKVRAQIVWVKSRPTISRGHYHWQHEPCFYGVREEAQDDHWRFVPEHEVAAYGVKEGSTASWAGGRKQSTVWFIEHLKNDTGHGTQKPVECMKRPMENNSSPGQAVYEPFCGSGTSVIAAEMTGRSCLALELAPEYVDVAVKRWQDFTGKVAVLEGDGRSFDDVAKARPASTSPATAPAAAAPASAPAPGPGAGAAEGEGA